MSFVTRKVVLLLQEYSFEVCYRPGSQNGNADALSRLILHPLSTWSQTEDEDYKRILENPRQAEGSDYDGNGSSKIYKRNGKLWILINGVERLVVPKDRREIVVEEVHSIGHFGVQKTVSMLKELYWWPKMFTDAQRMVKECEICQRRKPPDRSIASNVADMPRVSTHPNDIVAWDIMGPIQRSSVGNQYVVVLMDLFSKFVVAVPVQRSDSLSLGYKVRCSSGSAQR